MVINAFEQIYSASWGYFGVLRDLPSPINVLWSCPPKTIRKMRTPDTAVPIFLRTIALFLGLAVSKSSSKTLRIVFLILHPRSLCVSADFDGKINLRMSKSVFSGFCGVADFLRMKEVLALLSTNPNPLPR